ncbi:MAG: hypothetical protein HZA77_11555 [Candidatus Schekmanbacteria bacterium]|nr:hypothetical protein [Candidatus Schekmanbacteria bacterium]
MEKIWLIVDYLILPAAVFLLNPTSFWNFIVPWDEGQYSAAVNELMRGKTLYKDVWILYPPLQIYPLYFVFKIFGPTLLNQRIYFDVLGGIGRVLGYFTARSLLRNRFFVIFASVLLLSNYELSKIRVAPGLIAIIMLFKFLENKNYYWLFSSGLLLGSLFVFSQETSLSGMISAVAALTIFSVNKKIWRKELLRYLIVISAGFIIVPALFTLYFYFAGALKEFFDVMIKYPVYVTSGYTGLAFPVPPIFTYSYSFKDLFFLLTDNISLFYIPVGIYLMTFIYLCVSWIQRKTSVEKIKIFSFLIFGVFLFRSALGRSDLHHLLYSISPAIFIAVFFIEKVFLRIKECFNEKHFKFVTKVETIFMICLLTTSVFYLSYVFNLANFFKETRLVTVLKDKSFGSEEDVSVLNLVRGGGLKTGNAQARHFEKVISYMTYSIDYNEPVFIIPQQAIYYFLADRINPTKYCMSIFAITHQMREEVINDLKKYSVKKIVYELDQEIDGISGEEYSPELSRYIFENYGLEKQVDNTLFLRSLSIDEKNNPLKPLVSLFLIRGNALEREGPLYVELYNDEVKKLQGLLQEFPENTNYHNYMGVLYAIGKDFNRARNEWLECIKIDPNCNVAITNLKNLEQTAR